MKQHLLSPVEVLSGYDAVSLLYPHIPPMCVWRAWEYAAYQRYELSEPVLDVGCGDGQFFRVVWPKVVDVIGVDSDSGIVIAPRRSRMYREVLVARAHKLPVSPESFSSAFSNCSLEHMDDLPEVLRSIHRSLRPNGIFLLSVVTDNLLKWATLPGLAGHIGEPERALLLQAEYEAYHHLLNPLPLKSWIGHIEEAGFDVVENLPIVPEMTSRLFLFLDHLWHVKRPNGELGDVLHQYLTRIPKFGQGFKEILSGVLQMERDWATGSGAILLARRKE